MNDTKIRLMGGEFKKEKKQHRFTASVKEYLIAIFEKGRETNKKAYPADVARNMSREKLNDQKPPQILSYFSRLSLLSRKEKK